MTNGPAVGVDIDIQISAEKPRRLNQPAGDRRASDALGVPTRLGAKRLRHHRHGPDDNHQGQVGQYR